MHANDWISSRDGTKIFTQSSPVSQPSKTVVLVHGFAEHIGRYQELIGLLNQANISVLGLDLRGHGRSHGARGYIDSLEQYLEDLDAAVSKTGLSKVYFVAHSMGSLVASAYAAKYPQKVAGMVLSSPLFAIVVQVPWIKLQFGKVMSRILPRLSVPNDGLDSTFLTHDKSKVRAYNEDPLVFHTITARWFDIMMHIRPKSLAIAKQLQTPLLLQLAGEDHVVDSKTSEEWFKHLPRKIGTLKIYKGFYHEIYNEIKRKKPLEDMLAWLQKA